MEIKDLPVISTMEKEGVDYGLFVAIGGLILIFFVVDYLGVTETKALSFIFYTAPLWLPYVTFWLFYEKWMTWTRMMFAYNNGRSMVEIILPPLVMKSPEAMEFVLTQIYNSPAHDNLWQAYIDGKTTLIYSLELVSRGGDVRFYATLPTRFVPALKTALYAQYPGVEVVDKAVDYAAEVPPDLKGWGFISFHMNKKKDDQLPIKTYLEYKLDMMPKEEEKVDPLTPMLEVMSSAKPGEQVWVQFLLYAHKEKNFFSGYLEGSPDWSKKGEEMINKIMQRDPKTKVGLPELDGAPRLTQGERDTVTAIERNIGKYAYDVGIRWAYLADESITRFDPGIIPRMNRAFAQTEIKNRNGISVKWRTDINYKWFADPFGKKIPAMKRGELKLYKQRSNDGMTLKTYSVEELATLYHLPGLVALTPTLNRVTSTRAEAPPNLPTGQLPR